MPGLTGFEVVEALGTDDCPRIVFSTAFDKYAVKAFDAHAIDYLLKPYDGARFQQALDRAAEQLGRGAPQATELHALLSGLPRDAARAERLLVKVDEAWVPLDLASVSHLSAEGKHVRVHTTEGPRLVRQSLKALGARLDAARFVRVHRGEVVNLAFVARLEPWTHGDGMLIMKDGSAVVLSRTFRDDFLRRWGAGP
jgi:two-component system LytT family response regulator